MGYALLGKLVWRGGRWYLRRRYPRWRRKLAAASLISVLGMGGAAAIVSRRRSISG